MQTKSNLVKAIREDAKSSAAFTKWGWRECANLNLDTIHMMFGYLTYTVWKDIRQGRLQLQKRVKV